MKKLLNFGPIPSTTVRSFSLIFFPNMLFARPLSKAYAVDVVGGGVAVDSDCLCSVLFLSLFFLRCVIISLTHDNKSSERGCTIAWLDDIKLKLSLLRMVISPSSNLNGNGAEAFLFEVSSTTAFLYNLHCNRNANAEKNQ